MFTSVGGPSMSAEAHPKTPQNIRLILRQQHVSVFLICCTDGRRSALISLRRMFFRARRGVWLVNGLAKTFMPHNITTPPASLRTAHRNWQMLMQQLKSDHSKIQCIKLLNSRQHIAAHFCMRGKWINPFLWDRQLFSITRLNYQPGVSEQEAGLTNSKSELPNQCCQDPSRDVWIGASDQIESTTYK